MCFICPPLHIQCMFLPSFSLFYSSDAEYRKLWPHHSFYSWNCFGSVHTEKKRQVTKQVLRVWWKGMQVVLSEHLSSKHDQWACFEPSFLPQKKRIHDTIYLRIPHAARGLYAHLPCGRGSHHGQLCPGTVWYRSCANMLTWSWRQHGQVSQHWGPGDRPCPSVRLFRWGWGGCTATGSGVSTVGAVLEMPALRSRTWHRHASLSPYLQKCTRVAGLLGRGRCAYMVFCRQMQLYSML